MQGSAHSLWGRLCAHPVNTRTSHYLTGLKTSNGDRNLIPVPRVRGNFRQHREILQRQRKGARLIRVRVRVSSVHAQEEHVLLVHAEHLPNTRLPSPLTKPLNVS